jgi:hypothetical protein
MTKRASTVVVSTSTTPTPYVMEERLPEATHDSDPQIKTWLITASDDALIALWNARYGDGWRISHLESITLQWEENFDVMFTREMVRRGLVERHHHMAEQVTLYKLKCKS